jgi:DNA (cytosine-5)-methyltransferase 1
LIGHQSGLSDQRGLLIFEIPRFARELRPKVIVMEQVKGFLSANGLDGCKGGAKRELIAELESLGYSCQIRVLNAKDFGVAQTRERVFVVAARTRKLFEYPEPTHGHSEQLFGLHPFATVADAISGLRPPTFRDSGESVSDSHIDVTPARDRERISYVETGSCLAKSDAPPSVKGRLSAKDTTKFLRLDPSRQSNTLRCGEIFYHPTENRYLTPREYLRIHSYPDEYQLTGPIRGRSGQVRDLDQHRQVANSVPPLLAKAVGESVRRVLDTATAGT